MSVDGSVADWSLRSSKGKVVELQIMQLTLMPVSGEGSRFVRTYTGTYFRASQQTILSGTQGKTRLYEMVIIYCRKSTNMCHSSRSEST